MVTPYAYDLGRKNARIDDCPLKSPDSVPRKMKTMLPARIWVQIVVVISPFHLLTHWTGSASQNVLWPVRVNYAS